ncbi:AAA family ATPase [Chloroflexota bacterium]
MKVLLFGQIGLRKKRIVSELEGFANSRGKALKCFNVGALMYQLDPSIRRGRILQREISELINLRRRAWDIIVSEINNDSSYEHFIINTHATFRWENGLFVGFTKEEIQTLKPDQCITLIDDIEDIKYSLHLRENKPEPFTLKDIIVWREEEILAADFASCVVDDCINYIVARDQCPDLLYKLIFEPRLPKIYLSYPISLVKEWPSIWDSITDFRLRLKDRLTCFDPIAIEEGKLVGAHIDASRSKRRKVIDVIVQPENIKIRLRLDEISEVIPNIRGQIVARDFRLIDQSDMIVAYIPTKDDLPLISIGVERELAHARHATKDTYVIWPHSSPPSPFQQPSMAFPSVDACIDFIDESILAQTRSPL